ncbi:hypothetical protein [Marivita hallyeonensis]|uniref:Papain-like cysteine protease AvrRpt2 n=1 Tax=Marivita hallyeonensis TaxID=996342 RepID=A0A1M5QPD1_9RHOB|nr:hypothetical protein [Marivita hallyeonensis]SHH15778.1 hypothetical protein SAMN05443551_1436 [Marivita hallyeonensis]
MPVCYRESPTRLIQEQSTCWAAATEAYTEKTLGQEHLSYIELLDEGKAAGVVAWNGALRGGDKGVRWLATRLNLQWFHGTDLATNASMYPRLQNSHVIYMYRKSTWKRSVHTVCVWGTDENIVAAMDPLIGQWTFEDPATFDNSWELCLWRKDLV